jgi:hypothetical protein
MKFIFQFLFLTATIFLQAQTNKIIGKVVDEKTSEPIPYATLEYYEGQKGLVCDERGFFVLDTTKFNKQGKFIVNALGFEKKNVPISNLLVPYQPVIKLTPKSFELNTAEVVADKKMNVLKMGNYFKRTASSFVADPGFQVAVKIVPKQEMFLLNVNYYISKRNNSRTPFRIRIYEVGDDGLPGEDLLKENLIVSFEKKKGWFKIDLMDKNILIPENGIFVAMEWLYSSYYSETVNEKFPRFGKKPNGQSLGIIIKENIAENAFIKVLGKDWYPFNKLTIPLIYVETTNVN